MIETGLKDPAMIDLIDKYRIVFVTLSEFPKQYFIANSSNRLKMKSIQRRDSFLFQLIAK